MLFLLGPEVKRKKSKAKRDSLVYKKRKKFYFAILGQTEINFEEFIIMKKWIDPDSIEPPSKEPWVFTGRPPDLERRDRIKPLYVVKDYGDFKKDLIKDSQFWLLKGNALADSDPMKERYLHAKKSDILTLCRKRDRILIKMGKGKVFEKYFELLCAGGEEGCDQTRVGHFGDEGDFCVPSEDDVDSMLLSTSQEKNGLTAAQIEGTCVTLEGDFSPSLKISGGQIAQTPGQSLQWVAAVASLASVGHLRVLLTKHEKEEKKSEAKAAAIAKRNNRIIRAPRHPLSHDEYIQLMTFEGKISPERSRDRVGIFILHVSGARAGVLKNISILNLICLRDGLSFSYLGIKAKKNQNKLQTFVVSKGLIPFINEIREDLDRVINSPGSWHKTRGPFGLSRSTLQDRLNRFLKEALPHIPANTLSTHSLRRGVAESWFLTSGLSIASLKLGHRSVSTTKIYLAHNDMLSPTLANENQDAVCRGWLPMAPRSAPVGVEEVKAAIDSLNDKEEKGSIAAPRDLTEGLSGVILNQMAACLKPALAFALAFLLVASPVYPTLAQGAEYNRFNSTQPEFDELYQPDFGEPHEEEVDESLRPEFDELSLRERNSLIRKVQNQPDSRAYKIQIAKEIADPVARAKALAAVPRSKLPSPVPFTPAPKDIGLSNEERLQESLKPLSKEERRAAVSNVWKSFSADSKNKGLPKVPVRVLVQQEQAKLNALEDESASKTLSTEAFAEAERVKKRGEQPEGKGSPLKRRGEDFDEDEDFDDFEY